LQGKARTPHPQKIHSTQSQFLFPRAIIQISGAKNGVAFFPRVYVNNTTSGEHMPSSIIETTCADKQDWIDSFIRSELVNFNKKNRFNVPGETSNAFWKLSEVNVQEHEGERRPILIIQNQCSNDTFVCRLQYGSYTTALNFTDFCELYTLHPNVDAWDICAQPSRYVDKSVLRFLLPKQLQRDHYVVTIRIPHLTMYSRPAPSTSSTSSMSNSTRSFGGGMSRPTRKRLDQCTVDELRDKARTRGIKHSGLRKAELIAALRGKRL
jgi:hypothetical protein